MTIEGVKTMTHSEKRKNSSVIYRKRYSENLCLEIVDERRRNGREEWLSRWAFDDGETTGYYGYRWRKICGKSVFIPLLGRLAKDEHNLAITIRDPFNGKMARAYLRDFWRVWDDV